MCPASQAAHDPWVHAHAHIVGISNLTFVRACLVRRKAFACPSPRLTSRRSRRETIHTFAPSQRCLLRSSLLTIPSVYQPLRCPRGAKYRRSPRWHVSSSHARRTCTTSPRNPSNRRSPLSAASPEATETRGDRTFQDPLASKRGLSGRSNPHLDIVQAGLQQARGAERARRGLRQEAEYIRLPTG